MQLQAKLDAVKRNFKKQAPADAQAVMAQATENLRTSGLLEAAAKVGDPAPPFELVGTHGQSQRLSDLLAGGPLVLTFYRGKW
jgi:hypothetical protein